MSRPRFIFLNRFYWPDEPATAQLLADLASALAAAGGEVTVIASQPARAGIPRWETKEGVSIRRVQSTRWARLGALGKAVDFLTFGAAALLRLSLVARPGDLVIVLSDPPLLGVGAWLVARLRRARIFHWVQDIYPELAIELAGQRWLRMLRPARNAAWRQADGCLTLGTDMHATLLAAGVASGRTAIAPNWAPRGLGPTPASVADELRRQWGLEGKFVVAYSGNLGRVHALAPILAVARELRSRTEIAFVFTGDGAQRAVLEAEATRTQLTNVQFHPAQPRAELAAALALGDVHLVTLRDGCERLVFPSKIYGVAAVGRPVIFIGPRECELARLVETHGFGRAHGTGDVAAIVATIQAWQADPERRRKLSAAALAFGAAHAGPPVRLWLERFERVQPAES